MSFQKDVSTNIRVPEVQVPVGTGDDTTDALQVATFGLSLFAQSQERKRLQDQKLRQEAVLSAALDAESALANASAQKGGLSDLERIRIVEGFGSQFTSPSERMAFQGALAEQVSSGIYSKQFEKELSDRERDIKHIHSLAPEGSLVLVTGGKNLNDMSDEELNAAKLKADIFAAKHAETQAAASVWVTSQDAGSLRNLLSKGYSEMFSKLGGQLGTLMTDVQTAGDTESKVLLSQSKSFFVNAVEQYKGQVNSLVTQASLANLSSDQQAQLRFTRDSAVGELDNMMSTVNEMDDEQWKSTLRLTQELQSRAKIDAEKGFPLLSRFSKVLTGESMGLVLRKMFMEGDLLDVTADKIADSVQQGIFNITSDLDMTGVAQAGNSLDLKSFEDMLTGKVADNDLAIAEHWKLADKVVRDPSIVDHLGEKQIDNTGLSMIHALKAAEERGTEQDIKNASSLLGSEGMKLFMKKLKPEEQQNLSNYVAGFVAKEMERRFKFSPKMVYNADRKEVIRDVPIKGQEPRRDNVLTDQLNNSAQMLAAYHPQFKGKEGEAKDYLMSFVSSDQVRGEKKEFGAQEQQAITTGQTLEELEEQVSLKEQVVSLTGRIKEMSKGLSEKEMDLSDMDDEEFEEFQKLQREEFLKRRGK